MKKVFLKSAWRKSVVFEIVNLWGNKKMKKQLSGMILALFFISILFNTITKNANAGWEWQNPLPQGNYLTSVWLSSFQENTPLLF